MQLHIRDASRAEVVRGPSQGVGLALAASAQYANTWKIGLQCLKIRKIRGVDDIASLSRARHYHCIHERDLDTCERNASDHGA